MHCTPPCRTLLHTFVTKLLRHRYSAGAPKAGFILYHTLPSKCPQPRKVSPTSATIHRIAVAILHPWTHPNGHGCMIQPHSESHPYHGKYMVFVDNYSSSELIHLSAFVCVHNSSHMVMALARASILRYSIVESSHLLYSIWAQITDLHVTLVGCHTKLATVATVDWWIGSFIMISAWPCQKSWHHSMMVITHTTMTSTVQCTVQYFHKYRSDHLSCS